MARYRLCPTPAQEAILLRHCGDARYVWNLGHEQRLMYRAGRGHTPGYYEQHRQLTEARAAESWLAAGSAVVQQDALHDLDQAWRYFFAGTHRRPGWRKAGHHEGFRIVGRYGHTRYVRRLSRHIGAVNIPKVGWVRFRWSRAVPEAKSYRVTLDRAGRWHIAFAVIPQPIAGPGTGEVVGIDRGVTVSAALSTGEMLKCAGPGKQARLVRLQRKFERVKRGSNRREAVRLALARMRARDADRRKDWAEKASTEIARRFDVIRIEDLKIENMMRSAKGTLEQPGRNIRQKAGLNREIRASGWGILARRLEDKAPGRVEKINPAFTSQRCSACGHVAAENRKSQAVFVCVACGYACNADVNAAKNIAAGHAVTARGGSQLGPSNREPQVAA